MTERLQCVTCSMSRASQPEHCPFHEKRLDAGQLLVAQGVVADHVWYVKSGLVVMDVTTESGAANKAILRGAGTLIGIESVRRAPAPASVSALTTISVCRIDASEFSRWVGPINTPAGTVLGAAINELRARDQERTESLGSSVSRVARLIESWPGTDEHSNIDSVLRQDLARILGLRAETLSRALQELRTIGALPPGRTLRVADAAALHRAASEELVPC